MRRRQTLLWGLPTARRTAAWVALLGAVSAVPAKANAEQFASAEADEGVGRDGRSPPEQLAASMDVGFPDGVMAGVAYQPAAWVREAIAGGTNGIGPGLRGGVTLIPLGVGPSLSIQAGRYGEGDANPVASRLLGVDDDSPVLRRIGYTFVAGRLGADLKYGRFTVSASGGVAYLRGTLHRVEEVLASEVPDDDAPVTLALGEDPRFSAWVPSLSVGLLVYFI